VKEVPADSGNFPWYMTDSTAVLEDSEAVVNVIDLALNCECENVNTCKESFHYLLYTLQKGFVILTIVSLT